MTRLPAALAALLYLLSQAAILFHHAGLPESCDRCESHVLVALDCAEEDCDDAGHHHHHGHRHHPATCRLCASATAAESSSAAPAPLALGLPLPESSLSAPQGADPLLHRPIRAPPARA